MRKQGCAAVAAVALVLALGARSEAGTVTVNYGFNAPITALGLIQVGNASGTVSVKYQGSSISAISNGPVSVSALVTGGNILVGPGLLAAVGAPANSITGIILSGSAIGTASLVAGAFNAVVNGFWAAALQCNATAPAGVGACSSVFSLPTGTQTAGGGAISNGSLSAAVLGGNPGSLSFYLGLGTLSLGGLPAALTVKATGPAVGTEINRTFVPEPGTAMLLAPGLLGLALAARRKRRA